MTFPNAVVLLYDFSLCFLKQWLIKLKIGRYILVSLISTILIMIITQKKLFYYHLATREITGQHFDLILEPMGLKHPKSI